MANTTSPLTNTEIKQARPRAKEYNLLDGGGLSLRIKPSGTKSWLFNYQIPYTTKRTNMGLGTYPGLSLAGARKKRELARELLANQIDPKEERDKAAAAQTKAHSNTLIFIAGEWFKVKKTKVTESYADDIWNSFELHIFPDLGKTPLHKLTAPKAIATIKPVAAKGSYETVKRLCQRLNEVMVYAVNSGVIKDNPLAGISKAFQSPVKRNMPTLKPEQLPELMCALTTANIKLTTRCLIEWQLNTMVRPSEAAGARWDEIDQDNGLWVIPAERMKRKRSHTVPLTPQALALLDVMKAISVHREFIFPADRNPRTHCNSQTANMALKRMGFAGKLVSHGLRALASTTLNEQGFDPDVIEAALAHTDSNEVRAAYNRADYLERRKVMMCWWSDRIEKAATGNMSLSGNPLRLINNG